MPNNLENPKKLVIFSTHKRQKASNWERQTRLAYPYSDLRVASIDPEMFKDEDEHHDPGNVALEKARTVRSAIDEVKSHLKLVLDNLEEGQILGGDIVTEATNEHGDSVVLHRVKRQIPKNLVGEAYRQVLDRVRVQAFEELLKLTSRTFSVDWWAGFGAVAMLTESEHSQVSHFRAHFSNFPAEKVLTPLYQPDKLGEFVGLKVGPRAYWAEAAAELADVIEQVNVDGSIVQIHPNMLIDAVVNCAMPAETLSHLSRVFIQSLRGTYSA